MFRLSGTFENSEYTINSTLDNIIPGQESMLQSARDRALNTQAVHEILSHYLLFLYSVQLYSFI